MTILEAFEHSMTKGAVLLIVSGILFILIGFAFIYENFPNLGGFLLACGCIGFFMSIALFMTPPTNRYKVTFDKDYPVSSLIEQYNIIEQQDDILIIEEK